MLACRRDGMVRFFVIHNLDLVSLVSVLFPHFRLSTLHFLLPTLYSPPKLWKQHRFVLYLLCTVVSLYTVTSSFGQAGLTFHQLEKRVLVENRSIAAGMLKLRAAEQKLAVIRREFWPEISASYRYRPDRVDFSDDELNATNSLLFRLSQDIVQFTKTRSGRIQSAKGEIEVVQHEVAATRCRALYEFRINYLQLLHTEQQATIYRRLSRLFRQILTIAGKQHEFGEKLLPGIYEIEQKLINASGLADFYLARHVSLKNELRAALNLETQKLALNKVEAYSLNINKQTALQIAENNYSFVKIQQAGSKAEKSRLASSTYRNVHFTPYLGYRYRWQEFGEIKGSPEAGVRLSFPVLFPAINGRRQQQAAAIAQARQLTAENAWIAKRAQIAQVCDELLLTKYQLQELDKEHELHRENQRIEKEKTAHLTEVDRLRLLQLEAAVVKTELKISARQFQQISSFYRLLYLCGLLWPHELNSAHSGRIDSHQKRIFSTWLWDTAETLTTIKQRQQLVDFCRLKGINRIFLSINNKIVSSEQKRKLVENIVRLLHQNGVAVSALIGDPKWVFPQHRNSLLARLSYIEQYNRSVEPVSRFDAIHLDIEPHTLAVWKKQSVALLQMLLETVIQTKSVLQSRPAILPLEIDLPVFYHKIDDEILLQLVSQVDVVTLMAYGRTELNAIKTAVNQIINHTKAAGNNLLLGLNADDFGDELQLQKLIKQVKNNPGLAKSLAGFTIHDYRRYLILSAK